MSPKGTTTQPPAELNGRVLSHLPLVGPSPNPSALARRTASCRQGPPASDGFNPDGRKKFNIAAGANVRDGGRVAPSAPGQICTCNGPDGYSGLVGRMLFALANATAFCQFFTSKSPRTVFALIGRFRCRPPLKLYARLKAKPPPRSCSKVRLVCSE